ncbi:hypothetical protein EZV62_008883 [Acer yangbiense]|uniref:Uncharacterized protein n=1 Tax=Acer yangbiense TaxID=1000413 RepID=A0A5C7IEZ3_9ROSI|nr:hypothetical protein EZV62_008883 [Acer yangbiense]
MEEGEISSPTSFRKLRFLDEGHVAEVTKIKQGIEANQGIDLCIDLRGDKIWVATDTLQGMKGKCITEETPQGRRPRFQTMWNDIRKNPTFRSQFRERCAKRRKSDHELVFEDDCLRAISKLKVLGSGFEVIFVGKKKLVRSVPTELNKDHNQILELAQAQGFVTVDEVDALDTLLDDGLAMIDDGHRDGTCRYWFPCISSITSSVLADP